MGERGPRAGRDVAADVGWVALSVAGGVLFVIIKPGLRGMGLLPGPHALAFAIEAGLASAASAALWFRRRWPAGIAVAMLDTPPADIVGAVRLAAAGDAMLSPSVTRTLIDHYNADTSQARQIAAQKSLKLLTEREREVAAAVGRGQSNADIAARLYMSEATVKAHVSRILTKLNAANRVQVAITMHDADLA
jgi:DNA-binding CsgD family transcriptional regulator